MNSELARTGKEMATDRIYVLSRVCVEGLRKFTKSRDIMVGLQADINYNLKPIHTYMTNQQIHIYKCIRSHISILYQHASVTLVTIIRVSYNKNTITCW